MWPIEKVFRHAYRQAGEPQLEGGADLNEVRYLRPLLMSLPEHLKIAVDVGAYTGVITKELAEAGFRVCALEPHPDVRQRLVKAVNSLIKIGQVTVLTFAASDHDGSAELFVGSADTVGTLEESWTTVAFPEYFHNRRVIRVGTRRLSTLCSEQGINKIGFLKIDAEGHDLKVMKGMFSTEAGSFAKPAIIMFEANQRFPERAEECLRLLKSNRYEQFDFFIKEGPVLLAATRSSGDRLPTEWRRYGQKYFYVNIVAYSSETLAHHALPELPVFVQQERMRHCRQVLQEALQIEKTCPFPVHKRWEESRLKLRKYISKGDYSSFLQNQVCREMFFRTGWGPGQEFELNALRSSTFGRELLSKVIEPPIGNPEMSPKLPGVSTNMLGMMYYLMRVKEMYTDGWPRRIVEVGGGYGAFCYLFCREVADCTFGLIDVPEMLALQYYFLSVALPERVINVATLENRVMCDGQITLMPVSLVGQCRHRADLFLSTFGFSEMPRALQERFEKEDFFGSKAVFLAGQLSDEAPEVGWVSHSELVGSVMQCFTDVKIERFHLGKNYLLEGKRH